MDSLSVFRLPETLPALISGKADKPYSDEKKSKFSNEKVEKAVNEILQNHLSAVKPDEENALIRFFRGMSRDDKWIKANPTKVQDILRAITICFFNTSNSRNLEKIRKYVLSSSTLQHLFPNDVKLHFNESLTVKNSDLKISSLLLACEFDFFERMFRGNAKEAATVKEHLKNNDSANLPLINLEEMDANIAELLFNIYTYDEQTLLENLKKLTSKQLQTLFVYSERMLSVEGTEEKVKLLLIKILKTNPEKGLEWIEFANVVDGMPDFKEKCLDSIVNEMTSSMKLNEIWNSIISKFENFNKMSENPITLNEWISTFSYKLETSLKQIITSENVEKIFVFSKKLDLNELKLCCLEFLAKTIDLDKAEKALKGLEGSTKMPFLSQDDEHRLGELAFLSKLINIFQVPHTWNDKSGKFEIKVNKAKELLTRINPLKSETEKKVDELNRFSSIARSIQSVPRNFLAKLSPDDIEWVLKNIDEKTQVLNLENTNLPNIYTLERFENLQVLNLKGYQQITLLESITSSKKLRVLDLRGCSNLRSLRFIERLKNLEYLGVDNLVFKKELQKTPIKILK